MRWVLEANDESGMLDKDEGDLQWALALSHQQIDMEDEEADLCRAVQFSMQGSCKNISQDIPQTSSQKTSYFRRAMEEKRSLLWKAAAATAVGATKTAFTPTISSEALGSDLGDDMSEKDMLQVAVTMSSETVRNNFITEEKVIHFTKYLKDSYLCD